MSKVFRITITLAVVSFCGLVQVFGQCRGIRISGAYTGAEAVLNTSADITTGKSVIDYITLQYSLSNNSVCPGWSLKVQATNDFQNGKNVIASSYAALRFNRVSVGGPSAGAIGVSSTPVPLSTSEVTLINNAQAPLQAPPDYNVEHKLDLIIQGGNHLITATGTYSTTLNFNLYDQTNKLVSSKKVTVSFVINYNNSCSGVNLAAYSGSGYSFTSYSQQMSGATITDAVTTQYNPGGATCSGWSLRVRANGNFTSGSNSVSPQYFSLRFNRVSSGAPSAAAIGVSTTPVPLSMADVALISESNAAFNGFTVHQFDLIIEGGNHLLIPNGTYSTTLTFTLYNAENQPVSTSTTQMSFSVNSTSNTFTVQLQNSGNQADLIFNTMNSYVNGVNVVKDRGLRITGYRPYQVLIKAGGDNLESTTTSQTIPVSVVSLENSVATANVAEINCFPVTLSSTDQVIISNPMSNYLYQSVEYTQKYFTMPADARVSQPPGTYTGNIIFVVIPQ